MSPRVLCIGCLLWIALQFHDESAAASPAQAAFDYDAPASCPSAESFGALVGSHGVAIVPATKTKVGENAFVVAIEEDGAGYRGQLKWLSRSAAEQPRIVEAPACQSLVEALALTAALSVVPTPLTAVEPMQNVTGASGAKRAEATAPRAAAFEALAGLNWSTSLPLASMTGMSLGIGRSSRGGVREFYTSLDGRFVVFAGRDQLIESSRLAKFKLYGAELTACPGTFRPGGNVYLKACAFVEMGALEGKGELVAKPLQSFSFWAAAGGGTTVRYELNSRFAASLDVQMSVPLRRPRYVFAEPTVELGRAPPVIGRIGISIAVSLW